MGERPLSGSGKRLFSPRICARSLNLKDIKIKKAHKPDFPFVVCFVINCQFLFRGSSQSGFSQPMLNDVKVFLLFLDVLFWQRKQRRTLQEIDQTLFPWWNERLKMVINALESNRTNLEPFRRSRKLWNCLNDASMLSSTRSSSRIVLAPKTKLRPEIVNRKY